jgi:hypothetical protein
MGRKPEKKAFLQLCEEAVRAVERKVLVKRGIRLLLWSIWANCDLSESRFAYVLHEIDGRGWVGYEIRQAPSDNRGVPGEMSVLEWKVPANVLDLLLSVQVPLLGEPPQAAVDDAGYLTVESYQGDHVGDFVQRVQFQAIYPPPSLAPVLQLYQAVKQAAKDEDGGQDESEKSKGG